MQKVIWTNICAEVRLKTEKSLSWLLNVHALCVSVYSGSPHTFLQHLVCPVLSDDATHLPDFLSTAALNDPTDGLKVDNDTNTSNLTDSHLSISLV